MAKHLNVNLQFTADTSQAASQIKSLQSLLAGLTNGSAIGKDLPITKELMEAQQAAGRLKAVLADSLNPKGTVDIGRFTQNFKKAGLDINKVKSQMESLGPAGSKAFAQLAQSVATADAPLRRTSKLVSELSTTLKNTARWQLTSSMIHGFIGGLQEAYSYAQSLDKSLTNIRIVSGLSADEMARFAEQANKSAQALSTTTTKYTDAALIYYQQGLNDKEVKERTDTTIKMANVTGEQVQDVSSYMTAIWNNFNKEGDRAVEHYGDIMTKLGAETAASTDEIAAGLSKFSAVADTVGLSFEMASSSVTAIVDQTREAPEVVGTALKTIFSRVEGLKQGETLEDGVDLNKYSQGLKTVGVDIMDASGNLKDMDQILHEIGDRWETLDKNSQVALAQTVAGVRQYNQFIALFDNWDKVEENLGRAAEAGGTLQEQADIYAESWEAARNRVTAAAQAIYSDLLDDDFFKGILNTIAGVLKGVDGLIDSMGGLGGVIGTLGVIFTRIFEKQILAGISTMSYNIHQMTKAGKAENEKTRDDFTEAWKDTGALNDTAEGRAQTAAINQQATLQQQLYEASKHLDEATIQQLQTEMSINQALNERLVLRAKEVDDLDKISSNAANDLYSAYSNKAENQGDRVAIRDLYMEADTEARNRITTSLNAKGLDDLDDDKNWEAKAVMDDMLKQGKSIDEIINSQEYLNAAMQDGNFAYQDLNKLLNVNSDLSAKNVQGIMNLERAKKELNKTEEETKNKNIEVQQAIQNAKTAYSTLGVTIVKASQTISSATMGIYALKGAWDALKNEDMGFFEKFLSVATSLSMAFSTLIPLLQAFRIEKLKEIALSIKNAAVKGLELLATFANKKATDEETESLKRQIIVRKKLSQAQKDNIKGDVAESISSKINGKNVKNPSKKLVGAKPGSAATEAKFTKNLIGSAAKGLFNIAKLHPYILAAVAAAGVLVGIFAAIQRESKKEERALEEARIKSEELGTALNNASSYADELRSSIEAFRSAEDALDGCIKGTEEYRKALMNSNQEALKLLELYPELRSMKGAVTFGEDGRIKIADWALEEVQKEADQNVISAQLAKNEADKETRSAEITVEKTNLGDSIVEDTKGTMWGYATKQNASDDIADNASLIANWADRDDAEGLAEAVFGNTGDAYIKVAENLIARQNEFFDYADESIQEGVNNLTTQALLEDYLRASDKTVGYTQDKELMGAASRQYENIYDKKYKEEQSNDLEESEAKAYLQSQGITDYTDLKVDKDEISYKVGEDDFTVSKDTIDSFTASGLAMEEVTNNLNNLDGVLNQLAISGKTADKALSGVLIDGDLTGNSFYQNEKLKEKIGYSEDNTDAQNKANVEDYLAKKNITTENTANYDEIVQAILDGFALNAEQKEETENKLNDTVKDLDLTTQFDSEAIDKMGVDTGASVDTAVRQIYEEQGIAQAEGYIKRINEAKSQEDIEYETEKAVGDAAEFSADIQQFELDSADVEAYKDELIETNKACKENVKLAEEAAVAHKRMNKGAETLVENWESWNEAMSSDDPEKYTENLSDIQAAMGDLLNLSEESQKSLDPQFLKENWGLVEQAINGNVEALETLSEKAVIQVALDTTNLEPGSPQITALNNMLTGTDWSDIEIGTRLKDIDNGNLLKQLNQMQEMTGITATQMQDWLSSVGMDLEIDYKEVNLNSDQYEDDSQIIEVLNPKTGEVEEMTVKNARKMSQNDIVKVPVINGSKSNFKGMKAPTPSGGGTRGGGGGGGGSRPTRRTVKKKSVDTEKERYYTVTNQLEDLEHQLDKIEKAKDRAFGKNKIKAIDEEAEALNSLLEKQREYQQEIQDYLQKDKDKLVDMKIGVQFDKNGTITNYDKLIEDATKTFNDRISSYNAQSGSTQESWDKKYENAINKETGEVYGSYEGWAQAEFDRVKDAIDQYTETQDLAKDVESQIEDTLNQIYDLKLEKVEYTVELKVDVAEDSLELIDFLMERIEDDAFKAAEQIDYLGQTIDNSMDKIAAHRQGLVDLFNNHDLDGSALVDMLEAGDVEGFAAATKGIDFTEAEIDFIREAKSEILDNLSEIRDTQIQVIELVGEVFDSHMEEFDKIIEKTEHLQDVTNAYKEIVQLTGKKSSSAFKETMQMLNSTATDLAISQIGRTKAKYDEATREYNDALAQRQAAMEAGDEELVKHWDEVCEEIQDGMNDAQKEFMDAWVAGLEQAREEFQENMALIIEDFKIQMGGLAGSLDALSNQFDLHSQMTSNYLPDYERVYELNKLMRDINDSIDETDNVKAKRELLELEQEINKAREDGKPMSEYDLNYLRKRYELKVAELELKESKDAKSQVRMTKDSEGNFGYVYTADDAMVETAEQNYEDKLFEMQQMNAEYINTLQQSMIDLNNEYASQFEQLGELYEIGSAEYVAALEQLQAWYANQQIFYQGQLDGVMTNNGILYETEVVKYAEMTNNKALLDLEYISKFEQLPLAMLTGFTSMAEYQAMWEQQAAQMYDQAGTNAENFQARNDEAMAAAGEDVETFSDTVQEEVEEIRAQNEQITTEMDETLQTVQKNWDDTIGKVKLFETQYTTTVGNLIKLNTSLTDSMNKMLAAWSGVKEEEIKQNQPKPTTSSTGGGTRGGGGGGAPSLRAGAKIGYTGRYHANSYGTGSSGSWYSGQKDKVKISRYSLRPYGSQSSGGRYAIHIETLSGGPLGWIKPSQAFDTGGYTGKWGGKEGRMAMLHQKEIVLNETDTANFLKTVEIVRKISQTIDLNALSSAGGLSRGLHSTGITNNNRDTLKQDVHITAEFPNATDKNEILQAFDNVINLAAQYANRK